MTDEIGDAFTTGLGAALARDAGAGGDPEVPPPPRRERDPAAPHGRDANGNPLAPYGTKADGVPRIKPAGPGKPPAAAKARVVAAIPASPGKSGGPDYREDLLGLGTAVWLSASSIKGGRLGPLKLPDCRPYAAVWHEQLPHMAGAWNAAAQQNPTVRAYVEKFTGEGSMTWIVGVAIVTSGLVAACAELARAPQDVRDKAAAANDAKLAEYIGTQIDAMGIEAAPDQAAA